MARSTALMPYLHLPVQSGSDRILRAMNRGHTAESYLRADRDASAPRGPTSPSPATSSSASPARRDADFEATLSLVREVGYATRLLVQIFAAAPARRPPAMPGQVDEAVKAERLARLNALLDEPAGGLQRRPGRPHPAGAVRAARPPRRPADRPQPLSAGGPRRRRRQRLIGQIVPVRIDGAGPDEPGRRAGRSCVSRLSRDARNSCPCPTPPRARWPGPSSRHAALIEDAFQVLVETPGGGVSAARRRQGPRRRQARRRRPSPSAPTPGWRSPRPTSASPSARPAPASRPGGQAPAGRPPRRRSRPRPPAQARYLDRPGHAASWSSASARPAPARPSWPWPTARACCCAARSTG